MTMDKGKALTTVHTFVIDPGSSVDPDESDCTPGAVLVSIHHQPKGAAKAWKRYVPHPGEGWVSIKHQNVELIPYSLWCDLHSFWGAVIDTIAQYVETGQGSSHCRGLFSNTPIAIELNQDGQHTLFTIDTRTAKVDPRSFVDSVLEGGLDFYQWCKHVAGGNIDEQIVQIQRLLHRAAFQQE